MKYLKEIRPFFIDSLAEIYPVEEIQNMAYWSIEYILQLSKSDCIMQADRPLEEEEVSQLERVLYRLAQQEPLQYILGTASFYGLEFSLNEHSLIPRPETEELVSWVLAHEFQSVMDICCGTGCIAVTLAKKTQAKVYALDYLAELTALTERNAAANEVEVETMLGDILAISSLPKLDVMVSNPPYVLESEKGTMRDNVLKYEPHAALFVEDDDALLFYEAIATLATKSLNDGGLLFFEINEQKGEETIAMLEEKGFCDIVLRKDMQGKDRMIKALWKL